MTEINTLLNTFLTDNPNRGNEWLETDTIRVYVRHSERFLNGTLVKTIDIANVIVNVEYQSTGIFRDFILYCESLGNVYVEQVLSKNLETMLIKHGYTQHETNKESWYKSKSIAYEPLKESVIRLGTKEDFIKSQAVLHTEQGNKAYENLKQLETDLGQYFNSESVKQGMIDRIKGLCEEYDRKALVIDSEYNSFRPQTDGRYDFQ